MKNPVLTAALFLTASNAFAEGSLVAPEVPQAPAVTEATSDAAQNVPQTAGTPEVATPGYGSTRKKGFDFYLVMGPYGGKQYGGPKLAARFNIGYRWPYFGIYAGADAVAVNSKDDREYVGHSFIEPHIFIINNSTMALSINLGIGTTLHQKEVDKNTVRTDSEFGGRAGIGFSYNINDWFYIPIDAHVAGGIDGFNGQGAIGVGFIL